MDWANTNAHGGQVGRPRRQCLLATALAVGMITANADADLPADFGNVTVNPEVIELAGRLDDPDFTARQAAAIKLLAPRFEQEQLYALLSRGDLSAEQHHRLLDLVWRRLLRRQRGALGISMARTSAASGRGDGIEVGELLGGMPAERILRVGDRITHVDGQAVNRSEDLQTLVQEKQPADEALLTVVRTRIDEFGDVVTDANGGVLLDTIELAVPLGSADRLTAASSPLTPVSPVVTARRVEAAEAARRFPISVRRVDVRGQGGEPVTEEEIDRHPLIERILSQRRALAREGLAPTEGMLRDWRGAEQRLRRQIQQIDVTPRRREFLRRVHERYLALTPPPPPPPE